MFSMFFVHLFFVPTLMCSYTYTLLTSRQGHMFLRSLMFVNKRMLLGWILTTNGRHCCSSSSSSRSSRDKLINMLGFGSGETTFYMTFPYRAIIIFLSMDLKKPEASLYEPRRFSLFLAVPRCSSLFLVVPCCFSLFLTGAAEAPIR